MRGGTIRLAATILVATGPAACWGCSAADPLGVEVQVGPVLFDSTDGVLVTGAQPGSEVRLTASATDGAGITWTATARFRADDDGRVDTARAAPTGGDYSGTHATGLLLALVPEDDGDALAYETEQGELVVTYTASQGDRDDGRAEQTRTLLPVGVSVTEADLERDGIVGALYQAAEPAPGAVAVLVLGGSEGGDGASRITAAGLAARGVPALALAYFGAPGLPERLSDVPVEYFGTALSWLADQEAADSGGLAVYGASRGSEAALLTAVHYPSLVKRVVVASPTSFVNQAFPGPGGSAWTWQGRSLPAGPFGVVDPGRADADIPVAQIAAPMLLVCGSDDRLWPSCPSAERIVALSPGLDRTVVEAPDAGHLVDAPVPGYPRASGIVEGAGSVQEVGGTVVADGLARLDVWPRLLDFLGGRQDG